SECLSIVIVTLPLRCGVENDSRLRCTSAFSVMNSQKQNWRVRSEARVRPITRCIMACNTEWRSGSSTGIGASLFRRSDEPGVGTVQK
ncbi:hypothetical protein EJB05_40961, partial [Eragrostis curvula]